MLFAKLGGLVEKFGQPAVLGELVIGVVIGNLALLGLHAFEPILHNEIIKFLSELGVVVLFFQIGLESNITQMRKVGTTSLLVAIVGVVAPFVLGTYVVGPWFMPGLDSIAYLFLGVALTATSVGITARVFKDLGKLQLPEAQIVLGAAVIDDILGLIILAVVSAIAIVGAVSIGVIGIISGKAILFLIGAVVLGQLIAPILGKAFAKIQTGIGMKFTLAIVICLLFAFLAQLIGLAAIVGAFAAGLILDPVHFKYFKDPKVVSDIREAMDKVDAKGKIIDEVNEAISHHAERHIEDLIEPLAYFLVPIFFVLTGMEVNLSVLGDLNVVMVALAISVVAVLGKLIAGLAAGKVNKWLVGFGMVPRGEVGLILPQLEKDLA